MHLIEIRPNCSLTPRTFTLFYVSVLAASLPVALACTVAGFWPVLPFAGAELVGLWLALRVSTRRGLAREYIRIDERDVVVGRSGCGPEELHRFDRAWARVRLQHPGVRSWPSRLMLGAMGRSVEVGSCLTEAERVSLGTRLTELIGGEPSRHRLDC
ncbi:MAG: DUF2244 domain-containing protein [Gammaproteobacteria bacterium]|nr:DUF2244 domain-containing protein [Gammaproteobacteria bacterium]